MSFGFHRDLDSVVKMTCSARAGDIDAEIVPVFRAMLPCVCINFRCKNSVS